MRAIVPIPEQTIEHLQKIEADRNALADGGDRRLFDRLFKNCALLRSD